MSDPQGLAELVSLEGRVAVVTGGAGGIGSVVVRQLLDAGADVVSADVHGADCVEGAVQFSCDVGDICSVERLVAAVNRCWDGMDLLVHCAGITSDAVLWKMSMDAWDKVLSTNLSSAFYLLRGFAPLMRKRQRGSVVLVSSINGERGKFGQANYAASKSGLIGLARTAARELGAFGIRVNVISPGLIRTSMMDVLADEHVEAAIQETVLGRVGEPDDIARSVLFLVSEMSRHVTGQVLRVDGGQLIA